MLFIVKLPSSSSGDNRPRSCGDSSSNWGERPISMHIELGTNINKLMQQINVRNVLIMILRKKICLSQPFVFGQKKCQSTSDHDKNIDI